MKNYIDTNKKAWATIAEDHYHTFKERFSNNETTLKKIQIEELADIKDKKVIHLQCNTGADTISLARLGAKEVTGVDLVPENINSCFAPQFRCQSATDTADKSATIGAG